jgi:hypothetical protein
MDFFQTYGIFWRMVLSPPNPSGRKWYAIVSQPRTYPNVKLECCTTANLSPLTNFFRPQSHVLFGIMQKIYKEIELCKFMCKLCINTLPKDQVMNCVLCGHALKFSNVFQHSSCVCPATDSIRHSWSHQLF